MCKRDAQTHKRTQLEAMIHPEGVPTCDHLLLRFRLPAHGYHRQLTILALIVRFACLLRIVADCHCENRLALEMF